MKLNAGLWNQRIWAGWSMKTASAFMIFSILLCLPSFAWSWGVDGIMAASFYQISRLTATTAPNSNNPTAPRDAKETVKNYPWCFTIISANDEMFMGFDMSVEMAAAVSLLGGKDLDEEKNAHGYDGYEGGLITAYGGKIAYDESNLRLGYGGQLLIHALGHTASPMKSGFFALGVAGCAEYKVTEYVTGATVLCLGGGTGFEMVMNNFISVGKGKWALLIQPDLAYFSSKAEEGSGGTDGSMTSKSLRFGIAFRDWD
jgi:hypothetical protein